MRTFRSLDEAINRQAGVITRSQALDHLTDRTIRHRLSSGRWQTAHPGVYVTHSGPIGHAERRWIAVLGTVNGHIALLAGLSALEILGLRGFPSATTHVLIPATVTPKHPPPGVTVHRTTRLHPAEIRPVISPPCTTPTRSLLDAAQWQHSDRQAATIIMAGFQQRLVRAADISAAVAAMPRLRHRATIREAIRDAAGGVRSLPEADFVRLCRRAGLPQPRLQLTRADAAGRRTYLDAYFPAHGIHVEIDGSHHTDAGQWWADMRRQNELWIPGERVLRFPSWAIRHRPDEVVAQLRAALAHDPPKAA
ncbi:hypothetical protein ACTI_10940 [Actinoplanes sp. OR16]|uniref:hypothetical protein n=1 Tax=Actinoplanes sp. OR16 TaxID=946334 RepID=UPI000F6DA04E|nr:hypothetical protein [Actinoplanes sp. OR16]BBH64409.1 hypothetical protein ACTI_10940 [Actinoplanes sp. OR16]